MQYRRMRVPGGQYFFTVVTADRRPLFNRPDHIDILRKTILDTRRSHPFWLDAIVVLPDHLHCIWTLPPGDDDYPARWLKIKSGTTRILHKRGVTGQIWQRRYWEHCIRDEHDYAAHADYIHYNPVKHGLAKSPGDWQWSSFRKWVERGLYPPDWGRHAPEFDEKTGME